MSEILDGMAQVNVEVVRRATRLLASVAVASFTLLALCPDASARTFCSYSGPPQSLLTVTADQDALGEIIRPGEITTTGQEIFVREFLGYPGSCRGGVPTVLNTDTIKVLPLGDFDFVDVVLLCGPFAPGATPETEGAPKSRSSSSSGQVLVSGKSVAQRPATSSIGAPDPAFTPAST